MKLQAQMSQELQNKQLFDRARNYAYAYIDEIDEMQVFPSEQSLKNLEVFDEALPEKPGSALAVLDLLNQYGGPATIAQTGGRDFGFVNGGAVPASLGVKWLADVGDQCGGLYLTSPINAKLESVCESWLWVLSHCCAASQPQNTKPKTLCVIINYQFMFVSTANESNICR